jgi:predicted Zn-dependent peptidase
MLKTLDNGVRLIAESMPSYNSFAAGIWVKTGSTCEQPRENGISHFIEHMLFKGAPRSAQPSRSRWIWTRLAAS